MQIRLPQADGSVRTHTLLARTIRPEGPAPSFNRTVYAAAHVVIDPLEFYPIMLTAPAGIIALAALCGVFPAIKAYRTDVATSLTPLS